MQINTIYAISPVDGRYRKTCQELADYFSEMALFRYRVRVEIEYFIALCRIPLPQLKAFPEMQIPALRHLYEKFSETDAIAVKQLERTTNHDVKSVEYFIKGKMDEMGIGYFKEFVHFGLTSQDINNTAIPLSVKEALSDIYLPHLKDVYSLLKQCAAEWHDISMLARTHGQPASPTKLGKEILVYAERIENQLKLLRTIPFAAKFSGATGNFNAHAIAFPQVNWPAFADHFISAGLGLERLQYTTQIEHYDHLAALFDNIRRINTILLDLCRDIWMYISMNYFTQQISKDEVGSSAMPHKVNPIDFENAEGNLGMANALFEHMSAKLPVSRLQRDLTDSTVLRNIGVPFAHTQIALTSLQKGLQKIKVNKEVIDADLENNFAVVAEAIQTILRREGFPNPYEALKSLTRTGEKVTRETMTAFIDSLEIDEKIKDTLKTVTPFNYTGITSLKKTD
jgi:adenylosuccinate lyase